MKKCVIVLLFVFTQTFFLTSCSKSFASLPQNIGFMEKYSDNMTDCLVNYAPFVNAEETKVINETAYYLGEKGDAHILLKNYLSEDESIIAMNKLIKHCTSDSSGFIKHDTFDIEGIPVFRSFGKGRTHYLYSKSGECVYISASTTIASSFLSEYITYRNN